MINEKGQQAEEGNLKQHLGDYSDLWDDANYYKGSALDRKMRKRMKEDQKASEEN